MKKLLLAALLLAATPGVASASCYQWSTTAANNATADPSINWAEGMSPSSVNDSARAMMARLKECFNDRSGGYITTSGTGAAYNVTTAQGFDTLAHLDGQVIGILLHTPATIASPTLNVDGLGAKPIQAIAGTSLPLGFLNPFSSYDLVYSNAANAFLLKNFFSQPAIVPIGAVLPYTALSPPVGYLFPQGQCISRTTYADYFAVVGTYYGGCDGSTTFAIPDLRGRVLAVMDAGAGLLTSATMTPNGNTLAAIGGAETRAISTAYLPASGLSVPSLTVPSLSVPSLSVPSLSIPSLGVAGLSVPALSVPGLSIPSLGVAGLSVPGLSVPGLSMPSVSVSTTTANVGTIPLSSGAISSLQTAGSPTTNITPANTSGSWTGTTSLSGSGTTSSGTTGGGTTGTGTTGAGATGTGTTGTGSTGTGTTGGGATATGVTGTGATGTGVTGTGVTGTGTTGNMGSGTAFPIVQPTFVLTYILRVL